MVPRKRCDLTVPSGLGQLSWNKRRDELMSEGTFLVG